MLSVLEHDAVARVLDPHLRGARFKCCRIEHGKLFTLQCSSWLSIIHVYLAIDSGGCLYMNSALIAEWLNASKRSQDGVW